MTDTALLCTDSSIVQIAQTFQKCGDDFKCAVNVEKLNNLQDFEINQRLIPNCCERLQTMISCLHPSYKFNLYKKKKFNH